MVKHYFYQVCRDGFRSLRFLFTARFVLTCCLIICSLSLSTSLSIFLIFLCSFTHCSTSSSISTGTYTALVFPFTLLVNKQQGCFSPPCAQRQDGLPHLRLVRTNDPEMKIPLSPNFLILAPMRCVSSAVEILSFMSKSFLFGVLKRHS